MDVLAYRPDPSEFAWTFGGVPPVRTVKPGDILELWTEDAFGGKVRGPDDLITRVIEFPFVNPQTGPFFVDGAEPGDTLAIHFISIEPSRDWASSCTVELFGALTTTHQTATLHEPLPERVWIYEVDRAARTVTYRATEGDHVAMLPLDPMHGTVGVAPAVVRGTIVARPGCPRGQHGHPRDARRRHVLPGRERRGRAVLDRRRALPAGRGRDLRRRRRGGDGHGDRDRPGEGPDRPRGRASRATRHIMSTGSARPLEDAFRIAHADLIAWMGEEYGLEALDAYQLLTQVSESPVANVVDPNYTFLAKVAKAYLPRADAYGGTHEKLQGGRPVVSGRSLNE